MSAFSPSTVIRLGLIPAALATSLGIALLSYWRHAPGARVLVLLRATVVVILIGLVVSPALRRHMELTQKPEIRIGIDTSLSMTLDDGLGRSRIQRAAAIARSLVQSYGDRFALSMWSMGAGVRPIESRALDSLTASDGTSDLTAALRALTLTGEQGHVRALFFITDGASSSSENPALWARSSEIPVYTVGVGRENYPYQDLSIKSVGGPEIVFKESLATLKVTVARTGFKSLTSVPVTLSLQGRPITQAIADLKNGSGEVDFSFKPDRAGLQIYQVSVPEMPGELTTRNNHRSVAILVEEKPRSVLLLAGPPTVDSAFFERALKTDPRFKVERIALMRRNDQYRLSPEKLAPHAMIALIGFAPGDFAPGGEELVASAVRRGQISLLVTGVAPDQIDPLYASELGGVLPGSRTGPHVAQINPDAANRSAIVLTPLGTRHPVTTIVDHPQANMLAFRNLPPIAPSGQIDARAVEEGGGQVLATFPSYPNDLAALAVKPFGHGVSVLFNTFEGNLLRLLPAASEDRDQVYRHLVINLVDWMTDPAATAGIAMTLPRLRYMLGETVTVVINDYEKLLEGHEATLTITRQGGSPRIVRIARGTQDTSASFAPTAAGLHTIKLSVPGGPTLVRSIDVEEGLAELADPFAHFDVLRDTARQSGGAFFAEADRSIPTVGIDASPLVTEISSTIQWVDQWPVMALTLALLCMEWTLRRFRNLV